MICRAAVGRGGHQEANEGCYGSLMRRASACDQNLEQC